tara:strand:- start:703 stop:1164 length:462 start_codon:yes stop_codon:yes gene_type:complete
MSGVNDYEPYAPNAQGLTEVLVDLKSTMADKTVYSLIGFQCVVLENISQGQAIYCRESDGKAGLAVANSTLDLATVAGFARTSKTTGQTLDVITFGILSTSGLDEGDIYYLSTSPGVITKTPTSTAGQYVTRIGEACSSAQLIVRIEPPILLS